MNYLIETNLIKIQIITLNICINDVRIVSNINDCIDMNFDFKILKNTYSNHMVNLMDILEIVNKKTDFTVYSNLISTIKRYYKYKRRGFHLDSLDPFQLANDKGIRGIYTTKIHILFVKENTDKIHKLLSDPSVFEITVGNDLFQYQTITNTEIKKLRYKDKPCEEGCVFKFLNITIPHFHMHHYYEYIDIIILYT